MRDSHAIKKTAGPRPALPRSKPAAADHAIAILESQGTERITRARVLQPLLTAILSACQWLKRTRATQLASRRLRVSETVSLGDKRFLSIVQVDGAQFLIGCSTGNLQLLATLEARQEPSTSSHAKEMGVF